MSNNIKIHINTVYFSEKFLLVSYKIYYYLLRTLKCGVIKNYYK